MSNLLLGANDIQTTTVVNNGYSGEYGTLAGANVSYRQAERPRTALSGVRREYHRTTFGKHRQLLAESEKPVEQVPRELQKPRNTGDLERRGPRNLRAGSAYLLIDRLSEY
jgi:hypothetical protein